LNIEALTEFYSFHRAYTGGGVFPLSYASQRFLFQRGCGGPYAAYIAGILHALLVAMVAWYVRSTVPVQAQRLSTVGCMTFTEIK